MQAVVGLIPGLLKHLICHFLYVFDFKKFVLSAKAVRKVWQVYFCFPLVSLGTTMSR